MFRAIVTAISFSAFIYLEIAFGVNDFTKSINTILALVSVTFLLQFSKKEFAIFGFCVGILWFYWIALSFRYYDLFYLIPIIVLIIASIYSAIFYIFGFIPNPLLRAIALPIYLHIIEPFGFNWLKLEFIFVDTYLDHYIQSYLITLLIGILLVVREKRILNVSILILFSVLLSFEFYTKSIKLHPNINIEVIETNISQETKWEQNYLNTIVKYNLNLIDNSSNKSDLIILPEASMPLFLNKEQVLINLLKDRSKDKAILIGGLRVDENNSFYNSSYFFYNGEMSIADKVELVPFGESVPLPKFIARFINEIFFDGAIDYQTADKPMDFTVKDFTFRNLICFEGTIERFYKNSPNYFVVTSNNGWFTPSIEPTLQSIILRYYAKKYNKIIFHSTNESKAEIIKGFD